MIVYQRQVRFEEVDAAGIVFFPRFLTYAHEAMEELFSPVEGTYAGLIMNRRIGLPAVHVDVQFKAPLRYGDRIGVEVVCEKLGKRSAVLRYRMVRASDGALSAEVRHTVVASDLEKLESCDMPDDVRRVLEAHLAPA